MKTKPLYLEDSYKQEMDAIVLDVVSESPNRWRVVTDKTVFYPMDGGQPTDQGTLTADSWSGKVYQVLTKEGEIWHYIESDSAPVAGLKLHGQIDWARRYLNMRIHSAGHVVDFAMYLLGYSPKPLQPMKGDHSKKSFIVYSGLLGKNISQELEVKSNELIGKKLDFTTSFVLLEDIIKDAIYLQPGLPVNKPLRKLTLETVGSVADGGTQVKNTGEVGIISIPSIIEENENTIINYRIES